MENTEEYDYFNELERRYLLTLLLTENAGDDEMLRELDEIATRLEEDEESAEEDFFDYEDRILERFPAENLPDAIMNFPDDTPEVSNLKKRILLLYFSKGVLQGEEEQQDINHLAEEAIDLLGRDMERGLDEVDEKLEAVEDEFISIYFDEDGEDDPREEEYDDEDQEESLEEDDEIEDEDFDEE